MRLLNQCDEINRLLVSFRVCCKFLANFGIGTLEHDPEGGFRFSEKILLQQ